MEATILLCDHARVAEGKLYVLGAGWNVVQAEVPVPVEVAVSVALPWTAANEKHRFTLSLVDYDRQPVGVGDRPPVHLEGEFEVGRPPGVKPGTAPKRQMVSIRDARDGGWG